jgi:hypothetical protein
MAKDGNDDETFDPNKQPFERIAPRVHRFLMGGGSSKRGGSKGGGALESGGGGGGPPGEPDEKRIAAKLRDAARRRGPGPLPDANADADADRIAKSLVAEARGAVEQLENGASDGSLTPRQNMALEAVLHTRGRPALKIEEKGIEELDDTAHPGSGFWRSFLNDHEDDIFAVASAVGAVHVSAAFSAPFVQGTAWLVRNDLVVTNRHVLFPKVGERLARRHDSDPLSARMKTGISVTIDFAFDNGAAGRKLQAAIVDVPFVSAESDPIDVAVIRIVPLTSVAAPKPLTVSAQPLAVDQLYVVGHPGRMAAIPDEVNAVFGSPDERKRVSFGELMDSDATRPDELIHDASTIGGFSGGCVLAFDSREVVGLHHFGDPTGGNRAFKSGALHAHAVGKFFK